MAEALTNTVVESELAHFRENQAPRLKLVQNQESEIRLEQVQDYIDQQIQLFKQTQHEFQVSNVHFQDRWGFLFVKSLYQQITEYVVHRQKENLRLDADEIYSLTSKISKRHDLQFYSEGAKLGILLEAQDPLNDAELYYLSTPETEKISKGPLNSYPEKVLEDLFGFMREAYQIGLQSKKAQKSALRVVTGFLIPFFCLLYLS